MATTTARTVMTAAASLAVVGALGACSSDAADAAEATGATEATPDTAATTETDTETDTATDAATEDTTEDTTADATQEATEATPSGASDSIYTDGTYTATGSYVSPGGQQSVEVTLTIAADAVSAVEVVNGASDPQSEGYQNKFISGIESAVVGVPIDELAVDKVAGSSLTSGGFNDALEQIKAEALA